MYIIIALMCFYLFCFPSAMYSQLLSLGICFFKQNTLISFFLKKIRPPAFYQAFNFLWSSKKKKKEEISYVILTIKLCDFKSTCWILCTAELVSVSSPTMTALNSVMGSCLGSVKSTYSSDSESSGSAGTLCFFLGWRDGRLGLSWDMPSFSRVRVGWGPRWKHFMIESHKLKCFLSLWN